MGNVRRRFGWSRRILIIVLLLGWVVFQFSTWDNVRPARAEAAEQLQGQEEDLWLLEQVLNYIQGYYVDPVDRETLVRGALQGMLESLNDPYSRYFSPEEYREFTMSTDGEFGGVGMQVEMVEGYVTVVAPLPGTPAARAGIKPGDKIIKVDDRDVEGLAVEVVAAAIRGQPGTTVILTLLREGREAPLVVVVTRELIRLEPVESEIKGDAGYMRLSTFSSDAAKQVKNALAEFEKQGVSGVVLDLRYNPGGYLDAALDMAGIFVPPGEIVLHVIDREGRDQTYISTGPGLDRPLVVLVNNGSASAAEVLAGAIQDNGVGKLVGTKTFGKATVQDLIPLPDGGAVKVTTARYQTPRGREIQGQGLSPDVLVEDEDKQLEVALDMVSAWPGGKESLVAELDPGAGEVRIGEDRFFLKHQLYFQGGSLMAPVRFFGELLGAEVAWSADEHAVVVVRHGRKLVFRLYSEKMGSPEPGVLAALELEEGVAYVPLRDLAQGLGAQVEWLEETRVVRLRF